MVLASFTITELGKPALWTSTIAKKPHIAFATRLGQRVALFVAEFAHLRRSNKVDHQRGVDIAQLEIRFDEVVAGEDIATCKRRRRPRGRKLVSDAGAEAVSLPVSPGMPRMVLQWGHFGGTGCVAVGSAA